MKIEVSKDDGWSTSEVQWICTKCQIIIVQDEIDKCPKCKKRKFIKEYKDE